MFSALARETWEGGVEGFEVMMTGEVRGGAGGKVDREM